MVSYIIIIFMILMGAPTLPYRDRAVTPTPSPKWRPTSLYNLCQGANITIIIIIIIIILCTVYLAGYNRRTHSFTHSRQIQWRQTDVTKLVSVMQSQLIIQQLIRL